MRLLAKICVHWFAQRFRANNHANHSRKFCQITAKPFQKNSIISCDGTISANYEIPNFSPFTPSTAVQIRLGTPINSSVYIALAVWLRFGYRATVTLLNLKFQFRLSFFLCLKCPLLWLFPSFLRHLQYSPWAYTRQKIVSVPRGCLLCSCLARLPAIPVYPESRII